MYRKYIDVHMLLFYVVNFIRICVLSMFILYFSRWMPMIISSTLDDSFVFDFLIIILICTQVSCYLTTLIRTFIGMFICGGHNWHPGFILDWNENTSNISLLSLMLDSNFYLVFFLKFNLSFNRIFFFLSFILQEWTLNFNQTFSKHLTSEICLCNELYWEIF